MRDKAEIEKLIEEYELKIKAIKSHSSYRLLDPVVIASYEGTISLLKWVLDDKKEENA